MKKFNWLYCAIVIALMASCNGKKIEEQPTADTASQEIDSATQKALVEKRKQADIKTVISLAQLVLDTVFENDKLLKQTSGANLKKLWGYDEKLYLASNKTKNFIVTKEINPCCPCSSSDPMCCMCLIETDFAAVSDMEAAATLDGTDLKTASTIPGVDIFTIPTNTTGIHALKISGKGIPAVTYTVTIENGTIRFN